MRSSYRSQWVARVAILGVGLSLFGCMSKEDRIKDVMTHEIERCKAAEGDFHQVRAHDGTTYQVLAQLCHEDMTDVVMTSEFSGNLQTGPLVWTGGEDRDSRAMVVTRVSWTEFDRAMRYRAQRDPGVDELRAAETNFAQAQEAYDRSAWLRLERLQNLIDLQAAQRREVENPASIGPVALAYLEETLQWAQSQGDRKTEARAKLAAMRYLTDYRETQQRGINNLGAGDRRIEAAIEHAQADGNREEAAKYREELEERRARRPMAQAEMEERMALAEREMCEVRRGLTVTGIEDDGLRTQITSALRHDCTEALARDSNEAAEVEE